MNREHAMHLMKHLVETRSCIDCSQHQAVPADVVKMIIQGTTTFIAKAQNIPDMTTVQDTLRAMHDEAKDATKETVQTLVTMKKELRNSTTDLQRSIAVGEETKAAVKEAADVGKAGVGIMKEIKNKGPQTIASTPMSYAAAVANGSLASSIHNP